MGDSLKEDSNKNGSSCAPTFTVKHKGIHDREENVQKVRVLAHGYQGDEVKVVLFIKELVGPLAKRVAQILNHCMTWKILIAYAPLYIKHIFDDLKNHKLAISIPAEAYFSSKLRDDGGLVKQLIDSIKSCIPELADIKVLPQGVSALNYLVNDKKINIENGNILIIDGGFNTVNSSVVMPNGEGLYTETYFDELGVFNLLTDFFKKELMVKYAETTSNPQMLKKHF